VFLDDNDYLFFTKKMKEYKERHLIKIIAYCLMPNHFHIFIHQTTAEGLASNFAGDLTNSYTKTSNKKYKCSGVLFESRTKSKILYDETAFPIVIKYILLNSVKAGLVNEFDKWKYSSANEFLGQSDSCVTDNIIPAYFNSIKKWIEFMNSDDETNSDLHDKYLF